MMVSKCHFHSAIFLFVHYIGVTLNFDSIDPVSEEAGVVTVCVRVENSQLLQRSITVQLSTIQGTASGMKARNNKLMQGFFL